MSPEYRRSIVAPLPWVLYFLPGIIVARRIAHLLNGTEVILELTEGNKVHKILLKIFSLIFYGRDKSENHFQRQEAQNESP